MSALLYRIGRQAAERPKRVLLAWLAIALVAIGAGALFGGEPNGSVSLPGTETQRAADILARTFPGQSGASGQVVFHVEQGRLDEPARRGTVAAVVESLAGGLEVTRVSDPFDDGSLSADGRTAIAVIQYAKDPPPDDAATNAATSAAPARADGIQVEFSSSIDASDEAGGQEALGLAVAVVVLLVAFGSVVAMGLPIGTAVFGVIVGSSLVAGIAAVTDMPNAGPLVATMIGLGLGVGIDYALFVVTRHRDQLHAGMGVADSVGRANATAGASVLVAGGTVVVALAGLQLAGVPAVAAMGFAAALVVLVAMALAVTLLPALLGLVGTRIDRFSLHRHRPRQADRPRRESLAARWAHHIGSRPVRYAVGGMLVLLAVAAPVTALRLGIADDGNLPAASSARKAFDLTASAFGPGSNGPLTIVVDGAPAADDLATLRAAVAAEPGVASTSEPIVNDSGTTAVFTAVPRTAPQDRATAILVHRLRHDTIPAVARPGTEVLVAGSTTAFVDVADRLGSRLPAFIAAVVSLSFLLLVVVFRSVLVPAKAAVMNLLSIGAAYGVVVAVFQWGWAASLIGVHHAVPIDPFLPTIMFAILFGLSMDYEVFLISRIREEYHRTGDSHTSVVEGMAKSAKLITSAALIMIAVFASFIASPSVSIKMYGVGLAVAVLVDATLVRMVLVPATMALLGRGNWWVPRWLDRMLPHIDLEGSDHERRIEERTPIHA